jgi:hypothetical protein
MAWYTEWYIHAGLAAFIGFCVDMVVMPIKHKHPMFAFLASFCLLKKVYRDRSSHSGLS